MTLRERFLARGSRREVRRLAALLRTETTGGLLLIGAAVVAMVWANLSPDTYVAIRDTRFGPESLHLNLSVGQWASDGLLAVFFFLVGLELKHEFIAGDLRSPGKALVPVLAAVGGVVVPAVIFLGFNLGGAGERGWAIPAATDIAFALAVLAIISSHLPTALRTFLLTLAVVDDLIAIIIIAVVYTSEIKVLPGLLALIPIGVFAVLVQRWPTFFATRRWSLFLILLPLGILAWALVHASGIHATIAGVVLGMTVPVRRIRSEDSTKPSLESRLDNDIRPLSAGGAVPIFALFAAGVTLGDAATIQAALTDPVTLGVAAGLLLGKPLGIVGTTFLATRLRKLDLDPSVSWSDMVGIGILAGIGFTVSLLVVELSFPATSAMHEHAKIGVLAATVLAALIAAAWLGARNRHYRLIDEDDNDADDSDDED